LTVLMSNCARFTSDGINEIEGIVPAVPLPLRKASVAERLRLLNAALAPLIAPSGTRPSP
jgi:hypothetical protein